jgi:MFS family permease
MERFGRRTLVAGLIGFVLGTLAGLLAALLLDEHGYAFVGFVLAGMIFGALVGAFVGGMSQLDDPAPGDEPGDPAGA